jgi:hypothetical protein
VRRIPGGGGQQGRHSRTKKKTEQGSVDPSVPGLRHVRLAYQPPANSTFLSEQTSHQQLASSIFLSEQTSTNHQTPAKRTGLWFEAVL